MAPSPGLGGALLVDGPDAFAGDRQPGDVHEACVSAGVAELQDAVPLTLHPTHHCTAGVVLHLGRHPERERPRKSWNTGLDVSAHWTDDTSERLFCWLFFSAEVVGQRASHDWLDEHCALGLKFNLTI